MAAAASPTSRVIPSRCTVTSVRTVRLVPPPVVPERKKLARRLSHWYSRCVRLRLTGREYCGGRTEKASDEF